MFQIRTSKPESGNKYYNTKSVGGYNGAVLGKVGATGKPDPGCNVLANCVGYANGRFNEIGSYNECKYQFVSNAENFIETAKKYGLMVVDYPTLGGMMVFQKGETLENRDGAGHVFVVEEILEKGNDGKPTKIYTSESSWNGTIFWNATRTNANGRWGMSSSYTFRGCIINPAVKEEPITPYIEYKVKRGDTLSKIAKTYHTTVDELVKLNEIKDKNKIYVGQILRIPNTTSIVYTVQKGDTLWEIAKKYYGSGSEYQKIKELNNLSSNTIYPGQKLIIK